MQQGQRPAGIEPKSRVHRRLRKSAGARASKRQGDVQVRQGVDEPRQGGGGGASAGEGKGGRWGQLAGERVDRAAREGHFERRRSTSGAS